MTAPQQQQQTDSGDKPSLICRIECVVKKGLVQGLASRNDDGKKVAQLGWAFLDVLSISDKMESHSTQSYIHIGLHRNPNQQGSILRDVFAKGLKDLSSRENALLPKLETTSVDWVVERLVDRMHLEKGPQDCHFMHSNRNFTVHGCMLSDLNLDVPEYKTVARSVAVSFCSFRVPNIFNGEGGFLIPAQCVHLVSEWRELDYFNNKNSKETKDRKNASKYRAFFYAKDRIGDTKYERDPMGDFALDVPGELNVWKTTDQKRGATCVTHVVIHLGALRRIRIREALRVRNNSNS